MHTTMKLIRKEANKKWLKKNKKDTLHESHTTTTFSSSFSDIIQTQISSRDK